MAFSNGMLINRLKSFILGVFWSSLDNNYFKQIKIVIEFCILSEEIFIN